MSEALSPEAKAANAILTALNDVTLDLTKVGQHLARGTHPALYRNLGLVVRSAHKQASLLVSDKSVPKLAPPSRRKKKGTPFLTQCAILSELWTHYVGNGLVDYPSSVMDFVWEWDLSFALAHAIHLGLFSPTAAHEAIVAALWHEHLERRLVPEDFGFADLDAFENGYAGMMARYDEDIDWENPWDDFVSQSQRWLQYSNLD